MYDPPPWPPTDEERAQAIKDATAALYDWMKERDLAPADAIAALSLTLSSFIAVSNDHQGCTDTVIRILREWVGKYNNSMKRH